MHAIDLADLAGTFVRGAVAQVALGESPSGRAQHDYWLSGRYRHEYWMQELSRHRDQLNRPGASRRARQWHEAFPVMQEILLSEPLSRVIAYHAGVLEQSEIDSDFSPLAHSALAAHVEARNRCLHLIVFGPGLPVEDAVTLNRLRRTMESYTDNLLSCLSPLKNSGLYCFEPGQMTDTQARLGLQARQSPWVTLNVLGLSKVLWQSIRHELDWRSGHARLNYQLSQHVLRLSASTCFDGLGVPHSSGFGSFLRFSPEATADSAQPHPLWQPQNLRYKSPAIPPSPPPRDR